MAEPSRARFQRGSCPEPVEGAFQAAPLDGVVVLDPHLRAVDG